MTEPPFITNTPRSGETEEQTAARYNRPRDPLLVEREKTHGDFGRNAEISQKLKEIFAQYGQHGMDPIYQESLDMIALKLSRILSGQHEYKDHWDDIAGYAKLASEHDPIPF